MLSAEEKQEIDRELAHSPTRQAACIEGMKIVQRHRGWVSDEAIRDLAGHLHMSAEDLDGVATFYNVIFRRPVGRHVIFYCDSVSCWIMGYRDVKEAIQRRLGVQPGETTADGRFTLLPIQCLGACDRAPALMVDRDTHTDVTPETVEKILERYP
jgi:NADH-quinone oxidoreductase subunit E